MHAFAGTASIFFGPAPTTGLGLFSVEELFTQVSHVPGVADFFEGYMT
jgi:hypothetical protein